MINDSVDILDAKIVNLSTYLIENPSPLRFTQEYIKILDDVDSKNKYENKSTLYYFYILF